MTVQQIAQVCHEINRSFCIAMDDFSQLPWDEAPEWQKESAIKGVEFHLANPQAGPAASHESWMEQKLFDGWKYGDVKDAEAKTHPCIVDFEKLPKEQQAKDYLFRQVVHSLKNYL
jgi:hypothetical protein